MLPAMDTRTRHLRGVETIAIFVFPDRPFRSAPEFGGEGMVRVDYPSGNAWIIADPVDDATRARFGLVDRTTAFAGIHRPATMAEVEPAPGDPCDLKV